MVGTCILTWLLSNFSRLVLCLSTRSVHSRRTSIPLWCVVFYKRQLGPVWLMVPSSLALSIFCLQHLSLIFIARLPCKDKTFTTSLSVDVCPNQRTFTARTEPLCTSFSVVMLWERFCLWAVISFLLEYKWWTQQVSQILWQNHLSCSIVAL